MSSLFRIQEIHQSHDLVMAQDVCMQVGFVGREVAEALGSLEAAALDSAPDILKLRQYVELTGLEMKNLGMNNLRRIVALRAIALASRLLQAVCQHCVKLGAEVSRRARDGCRSNASVLRPPMRPANHCLLKPYPLAHSNCYFAGLGD